MVMWMAGKDSRREGDEQNNDDRLEKSFVVRKCLGHAGCYEQNSEASGVTKLRGGIHSLYLDVYTHSKVMFFYAFIF